MINSDFHIVGIGASAGGLDALKIFFKNLPPNPQASFVVVTHLPVHFDTQLHQVLSGFTSMPVTLLAEDVEPELNHVYVLPGQFKVSIANDKLILEERKQDPINHTIDKFFLSLAHNKKEKAIGVILSGCGSDGAEGANEIHKNGGYVLVQDLSSSQYTSMPFSAIDIDHPQSVIPPEAMGKKLMEITNHH